MPQTVSPEILERFKDGLECWNRDELDLMQGMYAEDAVFDVSAVFTDVAPRRGHESMRRYWNELRETWAGLRIDPIEAFDVGGGRYVVDLRMWGRGERSGAEIDQRFAMYYAYDLDDGKIMHAQLLPDAEAALSVAESAASQSP